jgi:hypothetical protein
MVELTLLNLPKEQEGRTILPKQYILRPRRFVMTISAFRKRQTFSFFLEGASNLILMSQIGGSPNVIYEFLGVCKV